MGKDIHIPPPPGVDATPEELAAYFESYDLDELLAAGYMIEVLPGDPDYPELRDKTTALRQLNLTFKSEEMNQLQSYIKKVHHTLETLAKQWMIERYQVEMAQVNESETENQSTKQRLPIQEPE